MTFPSLDPRRQRGQAAPTTISELLSQTEAERAARLEDVFTPAELASLEHVKRVRALGQHWMLDYPEVRRGLFVKLLLAAGRIGRGDRG